MHGVFVILEYMNYERGQEQTASPEKIRIQKAERDFANALLNGIPADVSADHAAKWASYNARKDPIAHGTWKQLAEYGNPTQNASYDDIMQTAIARRLREKPPALPKPPTPQRVELAEKIFKQPEFAADRAPYISLEELLEEYQAVSHKYDPSIASDYWLFTRSVSPQLEAEVQFRLQGVVPEGIAGRSFYRDLSIYLSNKTIEAGKESLDSEQAIGMERINHRVEFSSLDELYQEFKRRGDSHQLGLGYEEDIRWLDTLFLDIPDEEMQKIKRLQLKNDGTVNKENPFTRKLLKHLQRRLVEENRKKDQERRKSLQEQRRKIKKETPEPQRSPESLQLDDYLKETVTSLLPLLEEAEDHNDTTQICLEAAEEEFDRLPNHLQNYLLADGTREDAITKLYTRILIDGSKQARSKKKAEEERIANLPWWKRLFTKKK